MISQNLLELHTPHRHKAFKMNQSETRNEVENESHVRQYKPNGGQSSAWKKSRSLLHWLNYKLNSSSRTVDRCVQFLVHL